MKILAIWITKGLFIFVIYIAEWNVCSNLILINNPNDINEFKEGFAAGMINNSTSEQVKNTPIPTHDGFFLNLNQIQIVYDGWRDIFYIRSIWGSWREWKKLI